MEDQIQGETPGAQGVARGNLMQGVEHLMTAMRELLNTMTYRGDLEDDGSDIDDIWELE